jgi:hypothetical protein
MDPEVGLPVGTVSGMALVVVGFVHHVEARGPESFRQLLGDQIADGHGVRIQHFSAKWERNAAE